MHIHIGDKKNVNVEICMNNREVCMFIINQYYVALYSNRGLCDEIILMCLFVFSMLELIVSFKLNTTSYFGMGMGRISIEGDMLLQNHHPLDSVYMYRKYDEFRREQESSWNKAVNKKREEHESSEEDDCNDKEWDKLFEDENTPKDDKSENSEKNKKE